MVGIEQLLAAYFNVCEPELARQSVVIQSTSSSLESCKNTCKQLEENTLDSRTCTKRVVDRTAGGQLSYIKYTLPFKCICNEK